MPLWCCARAGRAGAQAADDALLQAREALRKKDAAQLAVQRQALANARHPLALWADYWELSNRLQQSQQADLDAFYARWPGTYVEDRLRNDWLLELGRRRDWANFRIEMPRFRMNDDREVSCYQLLTQQLNGADVRAAARGLWLAQRELDDGCQQLATALRSARQLSDQDVWEKARSAVEVNRPRVARAAVALLRPALESEAGEALDNPARYLQRRLQPETVNAFELDLLALMRMAASDPEPTAAQLDGKWAATLPVSLAATAWAHVAKQAALKQQPQAAEYARKAWLLWDKAARAGSPPPWSDDLLAWHVRAALRLPASDRQRWPLVQRAVDAMSAAEQKDGAWVYWRARAVMARAPAGAEGDAARTAATEKLQALSAQLSFYGKLATEELGNAIVLPPTPAPLSTAEREAPRAVPGFNRALQLIALGLRSEGVREWNFTLRGLDDRTLLAAAQWACEREVWDRCINTSDRTREEVDLAQRFPTPHRALIEARARQGGLDPAVVFGLIRQESRFLTDARSGVGASGLMQLMPATARWTAKQVGLPYTPDMINDREVNLQLGVAYLKRVLNDLDGSLAMATAAYNAGPGRPRRWREGATLEPAAWAETIPFNETRDYVKKVLSNSVYYAAVLGQPLPTLKSRLGRPIGPRDPAAPPPDGNLP
ncbi:MAG: lytic transglycosylase domain-containing protein [Rubrivivax sp.]|nr:lytic transglycosylase domain-containing protein [Rubrivivax sp.]